MYTIKYIDKINIKFLTKIKSIFSLFKFNFSPLKAFTLAEVLIVLGIIGFVAEMTIPSLMNNIQDQQFKIGLKKAYSVYSQAYLKIASDNGGVYSYATSGCGETAGTAAGATCIKDIWKNYIMSIKECDGGDAYGSNKCFIDLSSIRFLNGNAADAAYFDTTIRSGLISKDGMNLTFYHWSGLCAASFNDPAYAGKLCGAITVDVNGFKNPNKVGKDIYMFGIYSDRIRPVSTAEAYNPAYDDCIASDKGYTCAYKYLVSQ